MYILNSLQKLMHEFGFYLRKFAKIGGLSFDFKKAVPRLFLPKT